MLQWQTIKICHMHLFFTQLNCKAVVLAMTVILNHCKKNFKVRLYLDNKSDNIRRKCLCVRTHMLKSPGSHRYSIVLGKLEQIFEKYSQQTVTNSKKSSKYQYVAFRHT